MVVKRASPPFARFTFFAARWILISLNVFYDCFFLLVGDGFYRLRVKRYGKFIMERKKFFLNCGFVQVWWISDEQVSPAVTLGWLKRMFNVVLMTLLEPLNKHFNLTKKRNLWAGIHKDGQWPWLVVKLAVFFFQKMVKISELFQKIDWKIISDWYCT